MRKVIIILFSIIVCIVSVGAKSPDMNGGKGEIPPRDFESSGFVQMYTTAYCMGHTTANGSKVQSGGCACNTHLGEVAEIYTLDGDFLGYYEVNDTGGSEGLQGGNVVDVYRCNLTQCSS